MADTTLNMQWDALLHQTTLWAKAVMKGKQLLELNADGLESCLEEMVKARQSAVIVKLKWLQHHVSEIEASTPSLKSCFVNAEMSKVIEMYTKEFDLKACLAAQVKGSVNRRRLIAHCWVMEPYVDDKYFQSLPRSLKSFTQ
mmetsp:Transcript_19212/g.35127  ORF Transcript_19212/g.35127 Transcript_19212/m.35127 type:complete len:142 (+) Transcript_19212:3203-3628(+)